MIQPPNPAVTQVMRRARVSQALRAIEEGTRLDDLTDDEIDTIINAARDHRQSNRVAAGVGEGLREARERATKIAQELMVRYFGPGKSSAIPASWVIDAMIEFATHPEDLHARDALLLGGDAMRGEG